ncbi:hypothetical protein COTS27_01494 [Spirochaetota bacterium]|nr:hypothetical protein COTS27_01494 [Spirochaetota bacterium]
MNQSEIPSKFTANSIINYIAQEHSISKKQAKDILDSLFDVIEKGIFSGNRVPLGNIGKIYAHRKPATKERKGINPATRETITIKAKPATNVPKFTFSKNFKEKVKQSS